MKYAVRGTLLTTSAVGAMCLVLCRPAAGAEPNYQFDIPPEPLGKALTDFSRITSQQFVFSEDVTAGKQAAGVSGKYDAATALDALLANTGLVARSNGAGVIMIQKKVIQPSSIDQPDSLAPSETNFAIEQVIVSASRISIQGYEAPTPVTAITSQQLRRDAMLNIGDEIRRLPSAGQSASPNNGVNSSRGAEGDAGLDIVNLRNLGTVRTLVLFDGQRVVSSNPNGNGAPQIGGVDLSTLPSSVIERVDVVTGGASAAWGSDAVAGVVNLVINKTFSGIKGGVAYGNTTALDRATFKGELLLGTDFAGNRGHTEFAGTYTLSPDTVFGFQRPWYQLQALFPNSALGLTGGPAFVHVSNIGSASQTQGGLIVSNPAGTVAGSANALRGIQFVGASAQATPFSFGVQSGSICTQCSGNFFTNTANLELLAVPYHNLTLFNYTSYRLTGDITASVQLNYGQNAETNVANGARQGNIIVYSDNAYIPASVANGMARLGVNQFTLGTSVTNNRDPHNVRLSNYADTVGQNIIQNYRQLMRGVFTLNGTFGSLGQDWSWNAYAQHSGARERQYAPYNTYGQNWANATDPVRVSAAGPDSLGGGNAVLAAQVASTLAANNIPVPGVGSIACRSTLTATQYGITKDASGRNIIAPGGLGGACVPLDVFGEGVASQAAINYVQPGRHNKAVEDQSLYLMNQAVFAVSVQGTLPWGFDAGKVAVATGFEHRFEQQRDIRDPLQLGAVSAFGGANFAQFAGEYSVDEGFLEVDVPVLKNQVVDSFNISAAGRLTNYSTSGLVETWKLGAASQINDDMKVRTTLSSDIRAPGIAELFAAPQFGTALQQYPFGGPSYRINISTQGNMQLVPEQATTISGGIVLTPHWIENLTLSADFYSISIHKAIYSTGQAQIVDQCSKGIAVYCSATFFAKGWPGNVTTPVSQEVDGNGLVGGLASKLPTFPADGEGDLNLVLQTPLNAVSETTSGLDFQGDYQVHLLDGVMDFHLVGNYTDERTLSAFGTVYDGAGAVSPDTAVNALAGLTSPKLHATLTATYSDGPYEITAQGRYIGPARLSNYWQNGANIDNNDISDVFYTDLRTSYHWTDDTRLYAAIDNLFDVSPPIIATQTGNVTVPALYDALGRSFRVGVQFRQ